jgi:hypothetical protein
LREQAVFDFNGRPIDASWRVADKKLYLRIDDLHAQYPLTIDPIAQQAYMKASNTGVGDQFGQKLAVSGNTVVVGARYEDSSAKGVNGEPGPDIVTSSGAAYIFVRSGATWTQQAFLKASNPEVNDRFGTSVAISGDTVVVGASWEGSAAKGVNGDQLNNLATLSGAAYVFVRSGTTWTQQAYLKASNTEAGDHFGTSVAIFGDTVVVGAYAEDSAATSVNGSQSSNGAVDSGAAYVFVRVGSTWTQQAYLKASNSAAFDEFGWDLAISEDTVIIGADYQAKAGAAYIFVRTGSIWAQQAYLRASNPGLNDRFGRSVAIFGDTAAIGAFAEDSSAAGVNGDQNNNASPDSGAVYIFVRNGSVWLQQAYPKASNAAAGDSFGIAVAVSGDSALVGAYEEDSAATGINGDQNSNAAGNSGAAYMFVRNQTTWTQQAYLKASNTGTSDYFGIATAISGETVVVGAFWEDSAATGVAGDQDSNSSPDSGAAYIFDLKPIPDHWTNLGFDLAGTGGAPLLQGSGHFSAGSSVLFSVSHAAPLASGFLVLGLSAISLPLLGGVLVPYPDLLVDISTDAVGSKQTQVQVPLLLPSGIEIFAQSWILDAGAVSGWAATNAVTATSL